MFSAGRQNEEMVAMASFLPGMTDEIQAVSSCLCLSVNSGSISKASLSLEVMGDHAGVIPNHRDFSQEDEYVMQRVARSSTTVVMAIVKGDSNGDQSVKESSDKKYDISRIHTETSSNIQPPPCPSMHQPS